ncbi:MAG: type VI secretion system baseplate subunit TssK [Alphaproteobacteria bacterium]|nr:MAG: type VI secretion system baseplate subunit TssK [Alphaproteobacteria bacterium]
MTKSIKRIQWHEGMLLEPQHFQQQERFNLNTHFIFQSTSNSFFWGVKSIEIDEESLVSGKFIIKNLLALMQDGSVVEVTEEDSALPELDLNKEQTVDFSTPTLINLCIVQYREDAANIHNDFPRYESVADQDFVDENTGQSPISIPRLKYKITLLAGEKISHRYVSFPIARIQHRDDGFIKVPYAYPSQAVSSNNDLYSPLNAMVANLRKKLNFLASKIQTSGGSEDNTVLKALVDYSLILSPLVPRVEVMLDSENCHPFSLYQEICFIAGSLSNLRREAVCPKLPKYDHLDPLKSFNEVLSHIENFVSVIRQFTTEVQFTYNKQSKVFSLNVTEDWLWENKIILYFYYDVKDTSDAVSKWIENAVITSEEKLDPAREKRILGANREIKKSIPKIALPARSNIVYAILDFEKEFINLKHPLVIFNSTPLESGGLMPQSITLQAVLSEEYEMTADDVKKGSLDHAQSE